MLSHVLQENLPLPQLSYWSAYERDLHNVITIWKHLLDKRERNCLGFGKRICAGPMTLRLERIWTRMHNVTRVLNFVFIRRRKHTFESGKEEI